MSSRIIFALALSISLAMLVSGCKQTPKTGCENIVKINGQETSKANIDACYLKYFFPMRGGGAGSVDETPHIKCYNEAKTKEDVEKCYAEVMKVAEKLPGSAAAKAKAEKAADKAMELEAGAKAVALEACVKKCSAQVPEVSDPKYAECMKACKADAGL